MIERKSLFDRQVDVQRKNFLHICRLTVKSLIDKSCYECVDDNSEELLNFFAVMEHILDHRIKPQRSWYGVEEDKYYWDYISAACKRMPNSCIHNIASIENIKSPWAKGRAWLRCALMEKRLSEYISAALKQTKQTRSFYEKGAMMLSEESTELCGILVGLNAIDFSFCLKGENLEMNRLMVIDFTPYMVFSQSAESLLMDREELQKQTNVSFSSSIMDDTGTEEDEWRIKYRQLEYKFKSATEQKGYLEELVRLRDDQLSELQRQFQGVVYNLHHYDADRQAERQQFESIIIELQGQLASLNKKNEQFQKKIDSMYAVRFRHSGTIREMNDFSGDRIVSSATSSNRYEEIDQMSANSMEITNTQQQTGQADNRSIISGQSSISGTKDDTPVHRTFKEDTQSLIPMIGSLVSVNSGMARPDVPHRKGSNSSEKEIETDGFITVHQARHASSAVQSLDIEQDTSTLVINTTEPILHDHQGLKPSDINVTGDQQPKIETEVQQAMPGISTEQKCELLSPVSQEPGDEALTSSILSISSDEAQLVTYGDVTKSPDRSSDNTEDNMEIIGHSDANGATSGSSEDWNLLEENSD